MALAVVAAVPLVWMGVVWVRRRQVDGVGALVVLGLAVTVTLSILLGGSALPVKLLHPAITGTLGVALIVSTLVGRPLIVTVYRAFGRRTTTPVGHARRVGSLTLASVMLGLIFLVDAGIHVALALHVGTAVYLIASRVVTIGLVAVIVGLRSIWRRRN